MSARSIRVTMTTAARRRAAEPAALLMTAVFYALVVAVLAGVWRAAADANTGAIVGYSAVAITWYIATSEAATVSMNFRLIADIGADIASGAIAVELLRPASVLGQRVLSEIAGVLPKLAVCIAVGGLISLLAGGAPLNPSTLPLVVPSLVLAISCNVVAQHAFASATFWLRESSAAWFIYQKFVFMLGGMLIPLQVLPSWLKSLALATPFPSMAYAPARLAAGFFEPQLLLVQVVWLIALCGFAALVFGRGEHRLQVVGG